VSTRPRLTLVAVAAAAALVIAGCSGGLDAGNDAASNLEQQPTRPAAKLSVDLGGRPVAPGQRVQVDVARGTFVNVTLTRADGEIVDGTISGRGWTATDGLAPASSYTLSAVAENAVGRETAREWSFRTTEAPATDLPAVTPLDGTTVGVGHPVIVYFDQDVADKAAVEEHLTVTASRTVEGSWGWIDDRSVAWRPKQFWPGNTEVSLDVDLAEVEVADGIWGEDRVIDFSIGRSFVMRVDDATHQMTVSRGGQVVRTIPVSLGKEGFTTRSGVKVIMTQEVSRRMDSSTVSIGGSEAYDLDVPYAMRLTATGEFVHGAPWSEWAQGSQNVSHGCTNVSLANAIWLFDNTLIGDPVVTTGTGRSTEEWNGLGGIWNFDWSEWQARSALN
jgi:lipoprotein-anchoring transpeptidase ErfK/SrfK